MTTVSSILNTALRWLYKSIAILLVLFAVLLSCLRLLLPYASDYRENVQDFINEKYQTRITIGEINTGWSSQGPTLLANDISLLDSKGIDIFIGNFEVEIDFWKSLRSQQLITTSFTLEQAKIFIDVNQLDNSDENTEEKELLDQLSHLFLTQIPRFVIQNSQVEIKLPETTSSFSISELAWLNKNNKHQAQGNIIVDDLSNNKLKLLVNLTGRKQANLTGQAYFEAEDINITPWINEFLAVENSKTNSSINFQSWLDISQGKMTQFIARLGKNNISWQGKDEQQKLAIADGYLVIKKNQQRDGFSLYSSPIHWQSNELAPQKSQLNGYFTVDQFTGYVNKVDIASLAVLNSLFVSDEQQQIMFKELALNGQVRDIHFRYQQHWQAALMIDQFNSHNSGAIPGVKSLSAKVAFNQGKTILMLNGSDGELDFGQHFKRAIPYQTLAAKAFLSFDEGVTVDVQALTLNSSELNLSGSVKVNVPTADDGSMNLKMNVENAQGKSAKHYYPHSIMGKNLIDYLEMSITDGVLTKTNIVFDGKFKDFPFTEQPGHFEIDAEMEGANFRFSNKWPVIENLNANLNFTNNSMLISAHSGSLKGLDVAGVKVGIKQLSHDQILTVDASLDKQNPDHIRQLMNDSSLAASVGKVLNTAIISGPITGNFSLSLPIQHSVDTVAKGEISFIDNQIHLQSPNMQFTDVNGKLSFNNEVITVAGVNAYWQDLPVTVDVKTADKGTEFHSDFHITGDWSEQYWRPKLPYRIAEHLSGAITWQSDLALIIPDEGAVNYKFDLTSDLVKNELWLPKPFGKQPGKKSTLAVKVRGDEQESKIQANIDQNINFYGELDHQKARIYRANLVLGNDKIMLPMEGFHISAKLDNADVSDWQPFVSDLLASIPEPTPDGSKNSVISAPDRIRGTVKTLTVLDQTFNDVALELYSRTNWWALELNGKELRSQVKIFPDIEKQGLDINFDFLHIPETPELVVSTAAVPESAIINSTTKTDIESPVVEINHEENKNIFDTIPPLKVKCDSCKIGKIDLGTVVFEVVKDKPQTISLKNFIASRKGASLKGNGEWLMQDDYSSTRFEGGLSVKNIEAEMDKIGFASVIKDSGSEINFDINWLGGLTDFSTRTLNGNIHSTLDDGYLADVSDKGARLFSVLSLQSLVRKLTFDFRDIFSDGMFYSGIKGNMTIEQGVMYTNNLAMKGSAGDLTVKGNTNLINNKLDYRMWYKPNLTSSLPVLGWIATLNPVAIIAGVALDEVITSKVVSEFTFELTGTIDNPNLREVNRKNRNISVGRSVPPKIIDELDDGKPTKVGHNTDISTGTNTEVTAGATASTVTDTKAEPTIEAKAKSKVNANSKPKAETKPKEAEIQPKGQSKITPLKPSKPIVENDDKNIKPSTSN